MIKLTIDNSNFINKIKSYTNAVEELTKPSVVDEVAKAAFAITGEKFVLDLDRYAAQNPKKMHHVYEWGNVGNPKARLFVVERLAILNGSLTVSYSFLPSRTPVPVPPEMLAPGRTGKSVQAKNIFRDKARVMEEGAPITFSSQRVLAFLGSNGPTFVAPGTIINILNPGGVESKNAFADYMVEWYSMNPNKIMQSSGFYEALIKDASKAINDGQGVAGVIKAAKALADKVGGTIKEIA